MPAIRSCGDLFGGLASGCGCTEKFTSESEQYRCVDCGVFMHAHCLRKHFAMSSLQDLAPMVKLLRASLRLNGLGDDGRPLARGAG